MNQRIAKFSRLAISLLMALAGLASADHCVIGALLTPSAQMGMMAHCHANHPTPAKGQPMGEMPCCQSLRATVASQTKVADLASKFFVPLPAWLALELISIEAQNYSTPLECDTGPPVAISFTVSVLQRSILAHAPPVLS